MYTEENSRNAYFQAMTERRKKETNELRELGVTLKPCPFCGKKVELKEKPEKNDEGRDTFCSIISIRCANCRLEMLIEPRNYKTRKDLYEGILKKWNERV
ncbi:MAG: Lar family restriction alleviation protein [Oscillospiraceae bacterium]|jgi:DNA-directed RNA polymerase subunit RPC12/RpoP|nr:Lar family restriction alleviation protein [Oscillospiraceae bacterium]